MPEVPSGYQGPIGPAIGQPPAHWDGSAHWGPPATSPPPAPGPPGAEGPPWATAPPVRNGPPNPYLATTAHTWGPPVGWQRVDVGPTPERGVRFGARAIDVGIEAVLALLVLAAFGSTAKPYTSIAAVWLVLTAYETITVATIGATLGKRAVGLRVVALDHEGDVPFTAALRRGAATAALAATPIGWPIWLSSTLTDALTRNVADRAADTIVVRRDADLPVRFRDLPGYADFVRPPRVVRQGRVGDLDVRVRARFRRLNDAPALTWMLGAIALALSLPFATLGIVLVGIAVWVIAFTIDETLRLSRHGATSGHAMAGLIVVDFHTGAPPSTGRAFLRALVFALSAYTFVGLILLGASALMIRAGTTGRALHDYAGRTIVIADPTIDGEAQRLRAMRVRMGEVA